MFPSVALQASCLRWTLGKLALSIVTLSIATRDTSQVLAESELTSSMNDETSVGFTLFNATNLFNCGISFGALDESAIKFRIHLLSPRISRPKATTNSTGSPSDHKAEEEEEVNVDVKEIQISNVDLLYALQKSDLDPHKPFVFLMNGFNHGKYSARLHPIGCLMDN